jgi:hypothetical protein
MPHRASRKSQETARSELRSCAGLQLHRGDARKKVAAGSRGHGCHELGGCEGHGDLHCREAASSRPSPRALGTQLPTVERRRPRRRATPRPRRSDPWSARPPERRTRPRRKGAPAAAPPMFAAMSPRERDAGYNLLCAARCQGREVEKG